MKSSNLYQKLILVLCMIMGLSSCALVWNTEEDMDVNQSIKFAGQWTGDFGMYYDYRYRGQIYTFDSYDTNIVFYPEYDGATYGWGKQVDYYEYGPYSHIYNRFDWEILRGVIYIKYYVDNGMDCAIYDYVMTRNYFSGRFGNSSDKFYLTKIADYYDWSVYYDSYYFFPNDGWYWSPMYSGETRAISDSTQTTPQHSDEMHQGEDGIVSYGRRL